MPPELLKEGKLTRAADVYSFGVIMWELYSNKALHEGMTMAQVPYLYHAAGICLLIVGKS